MKLPRFTSPLCAGALTALFMLEACLAVAPAQAEFPRGKAAPAFALKQLNGKTLSLRALQGKVVFLDFWGPS